MVVKTEPKEEESIVEKHQLEEMEHQVAANHRADGAKEIANSLTHADITLGPDPLTRSEKGLKAAFQYVKRAQHLRKREG